jgi:hypothetical protein
MGDIRDRRWPPREATDDVLGNALCKTWGTKLSKGTVATVTAGVRVLRETRCW